MSLDPLESKKLASLTMPASKHRWLTAVSILSCPMQATPTFHVMCGDRKGSLHLYRLTSGDLVCQQPYQTLHGAHGPNGVTHTCSHQQDIIYTCGRNGVCRKYRLKEDGRMTEITNFKVKEISLSIINPWM